MEIKKSILGLFIFWKNIKFKISLKYIRFRLDIAYGKKIPNFKIVIKDVMSFGYWVYNMQKFTRR